MIFDPDIESISSALSTPLASPDDMPADWSESPATRLSATASPHFSIASLIAKTEGLDIVCGLRHCDLNKHTNRIHNKRAKCPYEGCTQKPFGFEADLQRHIQAKHSTEAKAEVECMVHGCTEKFSRKDNMLRHMRKRHPRDSL